MANNLPTEKKIAAVHMLCEGGSIRAIERMTGVHRDTIMRLGVRVGEGCKELLDVKMRNLSCAYVQVDEIWGFIGAKQRVAREKKLGPEYGDIWTWIAIDAVTKLIPSFVIGDRSKFMAHCFMEDLASRVNGCVQISSDALNSYVGTVEKAFEGQVDYGTVIKEFRHTDLEAPNTRYSPPDVLSVKKRAVHGNSDMKRVSTSFVEKQNHTLRMHCRRLSRLTNAFSKKRAHFEAAIAMHFGYYNLCKVHGTVRTTPAVAAGMETSPWTVAQLVEAVGE